MRRSRWSRSALLVFMTLIGAARAGSPRLVTSWKEKDARVVVFSPDGRVLVSSGGDGHQLRETATGRVRAVLAGPRLSFNGPVFSPDGRLLYAGVHSDEFKPVGTLDLLVWNVETGKPRASFGYIADGIADGAFAVSGDGSRLAFLDNAARLPMQVKSSKESVDGHIYSFSINESPGLPRVVVWDVDDWKRTALVDGGRPLAFSHDGKSLITGDRDWRTPVGKVWDTTTGRLRLELKGRGPGVWPLVVSPDGRLATSGEHRANFLWDLDGGRRWTVETKGWSRKPVFSRDGKLLFPTGTPCIDPQIGQRQEYDAFDLAAMPPSRLNLGRGELIISPDGRRYAAVQGERYTGDAPFAVSVYELPSMHETGRFETKRLIGAEFSPDGRRLALLTGRHEVDPLDSTSRYLLEIQLFDSDTARLMYTIPAPGQTWGNYGWRFSPDGNTLAVYYRTGTNAYRQGEPDPSDRPMTVDIWELPRP